MSKPKFINELSIPAVAAPMFLISGPELVIECCKNGKVPTIPFLQHSITSLGPEIKKRGAAITGMFKSL